MWFAPLPPASARYTSELPDDQSSQAQAPYEYVEQTAQLRDNDKTTLYVDFQHVARTKPALSDHIQLDYYRFEPYLRKAVLSLVKRLHPQFVPDDSPGRGDKEFFVAFYNMPEVAKYVFLLLFSLFMACA